MNPRRFEFKPAAAPDGRPPRRQPEKTVQPAVHTAAGPERDEEQSDPQIEEPGYGHGV
jgi:hypothetical protein